MTLFDLDTAAPVVPCEHRELEFYATDPRDVHDFLRAADHYGALGLSSTSRVLDPSAGGLARGGFVVHPAPYPMALRERYGCTVESLDIRSDALADRVGESFFDAHFDGSFDAVISNPPFRPYRHFVERALSLAPVVAFLLPLGVMEPRRTRWEEDIEWWRRFRPRRLFTHPRLKFSGSSTSAHQQYGHFVWTADAPAVPAPILTVPVTDAQPRHPGRDS